MIVTAVVLISVFPSGSEKLAESSFTEEETKKATLLAVMWGIIGAIAFSIKLLLTKWLMIKRHVAGDVSGIAM